MSANNIDWKDKLILAPMAGITDLPFRLLCKEQGCDILYTEMVSAKAILYKNRNTDAFSGIVVSNRDVADIFYFVEK